MDEDNLMLLFFGFVFFGFGIYRLFFPTALEGIIIETFVIDRTLEIGLSIVAILFGCLFIYCSIPKTKEEKKAVA